MPPVRLLVVLGMPFTEPVQLARLLAQKLSTVQRGFKDLEGYARTSPSTACARLVAQLDAGALPDPSLIDPVLREFLNSTESELGVLHQYPNSAEALQLAGSWADTACVAYIDASADWVDRQSLSRTGVSASAGHPGFYARQLARLEEIEQLDLRCCSVVRVGVELAREEQVARILDVLG